jgi:Mn2+/Fe2+ NRAMP family transporter
VRVYVCASAGVLITAVDVFVMMVAEAKSFRALEILVGLLTLLITVSPQYKRISFMKGCCVVIL